jgi:uncharacterized protein involved in outer membrane biogenesis
MPEERRWPRRLLISVASAIVITLGAVLAAPFLVPSEFIAGQIASLVRAKTNRDLRIAGPISFSLLPRFTLVAHDVALTSPPGGFSQDFLSVKSVDVALKPLPLLHGAIEIERLILSQPTAHFEVDANGERNWIFRRTSLPATVPLSAKPATALSFATGDAKLVGGVATYLDQRTGLKGRIDGIALTLSLPRIGGPLTGSGTAIVKGETVTAIVSLASPAALRDGGSSSATFDLSAPRATLIFRGAVGGAANATGKLDFKTPSLNALLEWADPRSRPAADLGALAVTGKLDLAESTATLNDATTTLDDVTARGTLVLHHAGGRVELDTADLAIAGGKASGKLVADKADPGHATTLALTLSLTGVTIHDLPVHIAGFDSLSGSGDIVFDLTGTGRTMHDIIRSLSGSAHIAFTDGAVVAGGLGSLLRNALGPAVRDKANLEEIEYRLLTASATIDKGMLRNKDLRLAGPTLSAIGGGTLDLAQRTLDYLWLPDIPGLGRARIAIVGAWDNPDYNLRSLTIDKTTGIGIPGLKPR